MSWGSAPYLLPLLVAAAVSAGLALYAFRYRRAAPGAPAFSLLAAAVAWWSFGNAVQLTGQDLASKLFWGKLQFPAIVVAPLAWLAFALQYTGRGDRVNRRTLGAAAVVPLATLALVSTTETHGLVWTRLSLAEAGPVLALDRSYGPWFWVHTSYSYLALLAGTVLILSRLLAPGGLYRWQAVALLLGLAAPWAANALFIFRARRLPIDPTPFALALTTLALAWALFRYHLLDIVPVAREALVDGMADAVMVLDGDNRILHLNPAAQRILGTPASGAIGLPAERVLRGLKEIVERYRDVLSEQAELSVGEGESLRHYELRISAVKDRLQRVRGRLVVWRDVTKRKALEDALRAQRSNLSIVYEVLRAVAAQLDPDAAARAAVTAIPRRTGWLNVVLAVPGKDGRHWRFEVTHADLSSVPPQLLEAGVIGRALAAGRTQVVPDVARDPDYIAGSPAILSELAVPLRRGERKLGVLDIESDRRDAFGPDDVALAESLADAVALALDNARLYRTVTEKHERLLAAERMRDDLTHALVHDLRSPLTSVGGVLEALQLTAGAALSESQREMLGVARSAYQRATDLVSTMLEVSRLEAGEMPLERAPVRLPALVADVLRLHAPMAERRMLGFECGVSADCPLAYADVRLVGRVLQNLVGNAVKFTPPGGRIRVAAGSAREEPRMLRVSVTDTGPGIAPDLLGRLFQRFVTGGSGQGSGLGLAFCRLVVEAHGGRIWAENKAGGGATFTFTLPMAGEGGKTA